MPAATHHKPCAFIALDFVAGQADFTTPRDALTLPHKRSHGRPLTGQQVAPIARHPGGHHHAILPGLGADKRVLLLLPLSQAV